MKLKIILILLAVFSIYSCGETKKSEKKDKKEMLKSKISQMEDSIANLQKTPEGMAKITNLTHLELINRLLDYYHAFPKDAYAEDCLFKVHMKFSELNVHQRVIEYGDTLLLKYPKHKNRFLVLESMASTYDLFIVPRDTAKIRYYYNELLKEKSISNQKKSEIKQRLKYIYVPFFDYVTMKK